MRIVPRAAYVVAATCLTDSLGENSVQLTRLPMTVVPVPTPADHHHPVTPETAWPGRHSERRSTIRSNGAGLASASTDRDRSTSGDGPGARPGRRARPHVHPARLHRARRDLPRSTWSSRSLTRPGTGNHPAVRRRVDQRIARSRSQAVAGQMPLARGRSPDVGCVQWRSVRPGRTFDVSRSPSQRRFQCNYSGAPGWQGVESVSTRLSDDPRRSGKCGLGINGPHRR